MPALRMLVPAAGCLVLAAGCGSAVSSGGSHPPAARPAAQATVPLATSVLGPDGASYAVVQMGGPAAAEQDFWQLFARPAHGASWRLITPLGVADNGGMIAVPTGRNSMLAGFRPILYRSFSPIASTANGGTSWSAAPPVPGGLAAGPGALAAGPAGRLIALTTTGEVLTRGGSRARWTRLITTAQLAATAAGRACGLAGLTAVAFGPGGMPLLGGTCARAGAAGIFAQAGRKWQRAGPTVAGGTHGRYGTSILALATAGAVTTALVREGPAEAGRLVVSWRGAAGGWATSAALLTGSAGVLSASVWPGGAIGVLFTGGRAAVVTATGGRWQPLSGLPAGTATLAAEATGPVEALAARGGTFQAWDLAASSWHLAQEIRVPVAAGSAAKNALPAAAPS